MESGDRPEAAAREQQRAKDPTQENCPDELGEHPQCVVPSQYV
jgi:hypothetical protein